MNNQNGDGYSDRFAYLKFLITEYKRLGGDDNDKMYRDANEFIKYKEGEIKIDSIGRINTLNGNFWNNQFIKSLQARVNRLKDQKQIDLNNSVIYNGVTSFDDTIIQINNQINYYESMIQKLIDESKDKKNSSYLTVGFYGRKITITRDKKSLLRGYLKEIERLITKRNNLEVDNLKNTILTLDSNFVIDSPNPLSIQPQVKFVNTTAEVVNSDEKINVPDYIKDILNVISDEEFHRLLENVYSSNGGVEEFNRFVNYSNDFRKMCLEIIRNEYNDSSLANYLEIPGSANWKELELNYYDFGLENENIFKIFALLNGIYFFGSSQKDSKSGEDLIKYFESFITLNSKKKENEKIDPKKDESEKVVTASDIGDSGVDFNPAEKSGENIYDRRPVTEVLRDIYTRDFDEQFGDEYDVESTAKPVVEPTKDEEEVVFYEQKKGSHEKRIINVRKPMNVRSLFKKIIAATLAIVASISIISTKQSNGADDLEEQLESSIINTVEGRDVSDISFDDEVGNAFQEISQISVAGSKYTPVIDDKQEVNITDDKKIDSSESIVHGGSGGSVNDKQEANITDNKTIDQSESIVQGGSGGSGGSGDDKFNIGDKVTITGNVYSDVYSAAMGNGEDGRSPYYDSDTVYVIDNVLLHSNGNYSYTSDQDEYNEFVNDGYDGVAYVLSRDGVPEPIVAVGVNQLQHANNIVHDEAGGKTR